MTAADHDRRRTLLAFAAVTTVLVLGLVALAIVTLNWSGVYPGVRVGGAELGGADRATAAAQLATEAGRSTPSPAAIWLAS